MGGNADFGPLFGATADMYTCTFNGTINPAEGIYTRNGKMNIGTYFNNKGVTSDQINKGSMAVTELEVYRVTDGEREIIPWRKAPEWKEKFNPALPISSETHGFVHQPSFPNKIHCVAFVVDASSIEEMPPKHLEKMISTQEILNFIDVDHF
ncbi:uncharacterized protein LOC127880707 [Dreissena polymorpha]|uniref:uncharacterized protein LOC127880707 n=1 Tax=Dreissena polymorpha TaxID=45954 RepID=UPI002264BB07|nr:uncharacterized protein LOC127880707 [Dreissena polymorpha]